MVGIFAGLAVAEDVALADLIESVRVLDRELESMDYTQRRRNVRHGWFTQPHKLDHVSRRGVGVCLELRGNLLLVVHQ